MSYTARSQLYLKKNCFSFYCKYREIRKSRLFPSVKKYNLIFFYKTNYIISILKRTGDGQSKLHFFFYICIIAISAQYSSTRDFVRPQ